MSTVEMTGKRVILRKYPLGWCPAIFLAIQILGAPVAQAQEKTTLLLAAVPTMPGSEARLTLMLTNGPSVEVTGLRQWIEFPKDKLSYVSSRLSIAGEVAEAELKVEVQNKSDVPPSAAVQENKSEAKAASGTEGDGNKRNISVLAISITAKKPLSDGPIAEILFNVPSTVGDETLTLAHTVEAIGSDGKRLEQVVAEGGLLTISKTPPDAPAGLFSCFFYMH